MEKGGLGGNLEKVRWNPTHRLRQSRRVERMERAAAKSRDLESEEGGVGKRERAGRSWVKIRTHLEQGSMYKKLGATDSIDKRAMIR